MAAGHDDEGWNRLGWDVMAAPGRRNGMVRLRMQAWSWRKTDREGKREIHRGEAESREEEVFGENAEECARDS